MDVTWNYSLSDGGRQPQGSVSSLSVSSLSFHPTDQCPSKSHQHVAVFVLTADINFTV